MTTNKQMEPNAVRDDILNVQAVFNWMQVGVASEAPSGNVDTFLVSFALTTFAIPLAFTCLFKAHSNTNLKPWFSHHGSLTLIPRPVCYAQCDPCRDECHPNVGACVSRCLSEKSSSHSNEDEIEGVR